MGTFGRLEPFDGTNEPWNQYAEKLDAYFLANDILVMEKKRAILMTVLDPKTYALLRNLILPTAMKDKKYDDLVEELKNHFSPKPSRMAERLRFHRRDRKPGESVATYVAELKRLTEHCQFVATRLEEELLDKLAWGINDDTMQRKLLAEEDGLTLDKAVKILQAMEMATRNTKEMKIHNGDIQGQSSINFVSQRNSGKNTQYKNPNSNKSQAASYDQRKSEKCTRCARFGHVSADCRFIKETCHNCQRIGHIAKTCRNPTNPRANKKDNFTKRDNFRPGKVNQVNEENDRDSPLAEYDVPVYNITGGDSDEEVPPPEIIWLEVNGKEIKFEVDSGSGHAMLTEAHFMSLPYQQEVKDFSKRLRSYTGHPVDVVKRTRVQVKFRGRSAELPVLLVEGDGPNLCGRKWLYSSLKITAPIAQVNHLEPNEKAISLDHLLKKHEKLFSAGLGKLEGVKVHIHVKKGAVPKFCKARTLPFHMKDKVEKEIIRMEEAGIIKSVPFSEFASPIVPVQKSNGEIRICGDFKITANPAIDTEIFPLPRAEDIFSKLAGCTVFSRLDLKEAYNQLVLDDDSKKITVINTTKGLFQYERLPTGISSSSAIFQRHMEMLLNGHTRVSPFQDDILLGGKDKEENLQTLDSVLDTLCKSGIKLRRDKCKFLQPEVEFLGHKLDADGLHPLEDKMIAIRDAPAPENIGQLRSFIGLLNYYQRFLPNNATRLAPLYDLLHQSTPWKWGDIQEKAFREAKESILQSRVLTHYDVNQDVQLACDASPTGIGAVISHVQDGEEQPISFASRSLTKAERNYSQLEKEALALVFGVLKFRDYLYGKKFYLLTDHQPLVTLLGNDKPIPQTAAARIQRWSLLLSAYKYEIRFRKGSLNGNADALSRLPLPTSVDQTPVPLEYVLLLKELNESPITAEKLEEHTKIDATLIQVRKYMTNGWPTQKMAPDLEVYRRKNLELSNLNGIILRGNRAVIPKGCQQELLTELHSSHQGMVKMKAVARSRLWWPEINTDIERLVKSCNICQQSAPMPQSQHHPWPTSTKPWQRVHADFAGPIEGKYLLIIVDSFTKWIEVAITSSTSTEAVTTTLRDNIARFGIMQVLVTDNGTCFTSHEFQEFVKQNGINHLRTAPYHPASNGQAERSVRIIKTHLKKVSGGSNEVIDILNQGLDTFRKGSLSARLARILLNYRRTPTATGLSPAEMMFGRPIISRIDLCHPMNQFPKNAKDSHVRNLKAKGEVSEEKKQTYRINDAVYARNFGNGPKWLEGTIVSIKGQVMFIIKTSETEIRRHRNQIRHRFQPLKEDAMKSINPDSIKSTTLIEEDLSWTPEIQPPVHDQMNREVPPAVQSSTSQGTTMVDQAQVQLTNTVPLVPIVPQTVPEASLSKLPRETQHRQAIQETRTPRPQRTRHEPLRFEEEFPQVVHRNNHKKRGGK